LSGSTNAGLSGFNGGVPDTFVSSTPSVGSFPQGGGYYLHPDPSYSQQPQQPYYTANTGQSYRLPANDWGYPYGPVNNNRGAIYSAAGEGTMTAYTRSYQGTRPVMGQRYLIPAVYKGVAAGTIIRYGRASYLIGNDGTMTAF
jgi:hypothetical protein